MIAGGAARAISATLTCPMELIRTYFQSQARSANPDGPLAARALWLSRAPHHIHSGIVATVRKLVQMGGVLRLWAGLPPTLLRDAPFSAIYWSSYEWIKRSPVFEGKDRTSFAVRCRECLVYR